MYLLHVNPIKSSGFQFDEETRKDIGGGQLGTDAMHLEGRGRKMRKMNEAGQGGVFHDEGKPDDLSHATDHTNGHLPVASTGGNGHKEL